MLLFKFFFERYFRKLAVMNSIFLGVNVLEFGNDSVKVL